MAKLIECYCAETLCYQSGRVAIAAGEAVRIKIGANGTVYAYRTNPSLSAKDQCTSGHGLRYTFNPHDMWTVIVDDKVIKKGE